MAADRPHLLSIVELGGYPDYTGLYQSLGFSVETSCSMRRALKFLQTTSPAVIVVEFKYGPVYGSRISNLESLFATVQIHCPQAHLIILLDPEDRNHLQRLLHKLSQSVCIGGTLSFPIDPNALRRAIEAVPYKEHGN